MYQSQNSNSQFSSPTGEFTSYKTFYSYITSSGHIFYICKLGVKSLHSSRLMFSWLNMNIDAKYMVKDLAHMNDQMCTLSPPIWVGKG